MVRVADIWLRRQKVQVQKVLPILLIASALTACVYNARSGGDSLQSAATHPRDCSLPDGWEEVAKEQPRYVVFGELHGSQQSPAFIGNLTCALATKGERILLAVEQSATDNAALQIAWRAPVDQFQNALRPIGWVGRNDGVASEAMFALLVRAHALKEEGFPIAIVAFNGARDSEQSMRFADLSGQGPHEAAQAENIHDAATLGNFDLVLVLVGSFHARKDVAVLGAAQFDPMARRLARLDKTISLNMRWAGGSSWDCILRPDAKIQPGQPVTDDAIDCGNHPIKGQEDLKRAAFIQLGPYPREPKDSDYDGFFWVGPINGSPPLIAE